MWKVKLENLSKDSKSKLIKLIQNWWTKKWWIKIDYTPILFKWWKCFNTSLWIKDLNVLIKEKITTKTWVNWKLNIWYWKLNETYMAENLVSILWVAITWKEWEKQNEKKKRKT